jgi:hypothetical protein
MSIETILQHEIAKFTLPFLLIFFIVFALLEKTKLLGDEKKQLNALVSFIVGLIFVSAVFPKIIVGDLILFLTVALVAIFVALLLWGFVSGGELEKSFLSNKYVKWAVGIVVVVAVIIVLLCSANIDLGILNWPFTQTWSSGFWTNVVFIVVIAAALALVIGKAKEGK